MTKRLLATADGIALACVGGYCFAMALIACLDELYARPCSGFDIVTTLMCASPRLFICMVGGYVYWIGMSRLRWPN